MFSNVLRVQADLAIGRRLDSPNLQTRTKREQTHGTGMPASRQALLTAVRVKIAALETLGRPVGEVLAFGDGRVDGRLPGGGLGLGRWHEFAGEGLELETAAAAAAFAARLAAPLAARGELVWVLRRDDLHAPGLAGLGFAAERLIQVCARDEA